MKSNNSRLTPRNLLIVLLVVLTLNSLGEMFGVHGPAQEEPVEMNITEVMRAARDGRIEAAEWEGSELSGKLRDGPAFWATLPYSTEIAMKLSDSGVDVGVKRPGLLKLVFGVFISLVPVLLLIGFLLLIMRGGSRSGLFSVGKSRARLMDGKTVGVKFADVAGIDEAKADLSEVVDFLKDPGKFSRLGGRIPHGVLLSGPPGTGKTLLAKAIAGEAGVPFFSISGSDFVEMFVGVGASRVRDMFANAKKSAPCIVFIDEIDAMGRHRGAGLGGGNDEREQTLNQLLVEMNGFEENAGVIVIAATNRPDVLDPALLRPGRFDRHIVVQAPDVAGRIAILKVHAGRVVMAPEVDIEAIARATPGFSGAELANLVNEAALLAGRRESASVSMADFEDARDKILMGPERRTMMMSEDERVLTAYHEAGHAVVAMEIPGNDPLHKITIVPRGRALGVTMSLPDRDRHSMTAAEIKARLAMMYGGRAAEELVFGPEMITTGASDDIRRATDLARRMVTEWGLSSMGPIRFSNDDEEIFLGRSVTRHRNLSETTAADIDAEIAGILGDAEQLAAATLAARREGLDKLAGALLEYETLSAAEAQDIVKRGIMPARKLA